MGLLKYLMQYRFHDMAELIRNDKNPPLVCNGNLKGKLVVISGATSGIGRETALLFASKGAKLICLNRNEEKSRNLEKELYEKYGTEVKSIPVDFSSMNQTKECGRLLQEIREPVDVIIHNAGCFFTRKHFTEDRIEMVFQVNHLSSFCLNYMLKEKLLRENRARILYVNSEGHRFALSGVHLKDLEWKRHIYTGLKSYGAAKTAQLLTMMKFKEFFSQSSVTINAMHPGNVRSHIGENNGKLYRWMKNKLILSSAKDAEISAKALLYLALSKEIEHSSGIFYNLTTPEKPAPHARDLDKVEAVWNKSLELCGGNE